MTKLTFESPIEIFERSIEMDRFADILARLKEITPETSLQVSLRDNTFITKIVIFPAVPVEKKEDMEKLAKDFGAVLEM